MPCVVGGKDGVDGVGVVGDGGTGGDCGTSGGFRWDLLVVYRARRVHWVSLFQVFVDL